jgi:hypothetical protein
MESVRVHLGARGVDPTELGCDDMHSREQEYQDREWQNARSLIDRKQNCSPYGMARTECNDSLITPRWSAHLLGLQPAELLARFAQCLNGESRIR